MSMRVSEDLFTSGEYTLSLLIDLIHETRAKYMMVLHKFTTGLPLHMSTINGSMPGKWGFHLLGSENGNITSMDSYKLASLLPIKKMF